MKNIKIETMSQEYDYILNASRRSGVPVKKIIDMLVLLSTNKSIDAERIIAETAMSKSSLEQVRKYLVQKLIIYEKEKYSLFRSEIINELDKVKEDHIYSYLENNLYRSIVPKVRYYKEKLPSPNRKIDQFYSNAITVGRRVSIMNFLGDIKGKRILFIGDDDLTSIGASLVNTAKNISVIDIDSKILDEINRINNIENLTIKTKKHDVINPLDTDLSKQFDVVFTDPPYTQEGFSLFLNRAIESLDPKNDSGRIYICYGSSDRSKERYLPVYDTLQRAGLLIRYCFDKFNRYKEAGSIGSASTLFICDVTPKTKPVTIKQTNDIYTR